MPPEDIQYRIFRRLNNQFFLQKSVEPWKIRLFDTSKFADPVLIGEKMFGQGLWILKGFFVLSYTFQCFIQDLKVLRLHKFGSKSWPRLADPQRTISGIHCMLLLQQNVWNRLWASWGCPCMKCWMWSTQIWTAHQSWGKIAPKMELKTTPTFPAV